MGSQKFVLIGSRPPSLASNNARSPVANHSHTAKDGYAGCLVGRHRHPSKRTREGCIALCESFHRNAKKREDSMNLQRRGFLLVIILTSADRDHDLWKRWQ
jgi:hypothetical protein